MAPLNFRQRLCIFSELRPYKDEPLVNKKAKQKKLMFYLFKIEFLRYILHSGFMKKYAPEDSCSRE